jgi:uncharacterized protein (TIGR03067 family)
MAIPCLLFVVSILLTSEANDKILAKDKELLQGAWIPFAVAENGKVMNKEPEETGAKMKRLIFSGNTCRIETYEFEETTIRKARFKLNTKENPRQIDLLVEDETEQAIYSVSKNELRICCGSRGMDRPTGFKTKGQQDVQLWIFRREKPQHKVRE